MAVTPCQRLLGRVSKATRERILFSTGINQQSTAQNTKRNNVMIVTRGRRVQVVRTMRRDGRFERDKPGVLHREHVFL